MSKFDEILETLKEEHPDIVDSLSTAYVDDMETRDSKITSLETEIVGQRDKINTYARENYDLMRKQPSGDSPNLNGDKPKPPPTLDDVAAHWRNK